MGGRENSDKNSEASAENCEDDDNCSGTLYIMIYRLIVYIGDMEPSGDDYEASADDCEDESLNCPGTLYIIWNNFENNFDVIIEFSNCRN